MAAGAPAFFNNKEELQEKIDEYFVWIQGDFEDTETTEFDLQENRLITKKERVWKRYPEAPTITGMCLHLGFESRQSFHDYGNKSEFSYTIKRARLRIEKEYELSLRHAKNAAGPIFALKNLGWADKQEIDHTTKGQALNEAVDLSKLSDEELRIRAAIDRKSRGA